MQAAMEAVTNMLQFDFSAINDVVGYLSYQFGRHFFTATAHQKYLDPFSERNVNIWMQEFLSKEHFCWLYTEL